MKSPNLLFKITASAAVIDTDALTLDNAPRVSSPSGLGTPQRALFPLEAEDTQLIFHLLQKVETFLA